MYIPYRTLVLALLATTIYCQTITSDVANNSSTTINSPNGEFPPITININVMMPGNDVMPLNNFVPPQIPVMNDPILIEDDNITSSAIDDSELLQAPIMLNSSDTLQPNITSDNSSSIIIPLVPTITNTSTNETQESNMPSVQNVTNSTSSQLPYLNNVIVMGNDAGSNKNKGITFVIISMMLAYITA